MVEDTMPRYTTKRLKHEIERAREYDQREIAILRAELEQVKRERDEANAMLADSYGSPVEGHKLFAERLAGARVVTDAMVAAFQNKYREFWKGSWPDTETSRELLKAALAEPAGEVDMVKHGPGCGSHNDYPCDCQALTTPPDASAIREAATQLLSAIDTGCGREEIISQTGPLRAALAGAKP